MRLILWEARLSKGVSQTELAARSGITQKTISLLENGHSQPHPRTVRLLAAALGVEPWELVERGNAGQVDASNPTRD